MTAEDERQLLAEKPALKQIYDAQVGEGPSVWCASYAMCMHTSTSCGTDTRGGKRAHVARPHFGGGGMTPVTTGHSACIPGLVGVWWVLSLCLRHGATCSSACVKLLCTLEATENVSCSVTSPPALAGWSHHDQGGVLAALLQVTRACLCTTDTHTAALTTLTAEQHCACMLRHQLTTPVGGARMARSLLLQSQL